MNVLRRRGKSLRAIAAEVGCAVNTVRRHLDHPELPRYAKRHSPRPKLGAFEAYLRDRIASSDGERVPASLLAREIRGRGYQGSDRQVLRFIRKLRSHGDDPSPARADPGADTHMQVDWIEFRSAPGDMLTAFVAVLGRSLASYVEYVTDPGMATILACHRRAFEFFGGVPRTVLYESSHAVFARPDAYGPDRHHFHTTFLDFSRHYGFLPRLFGASRHKTKADVERMVRYLRYSFHLPLLTRLSRSGLDLGVDTANVEVRRWLRDVVNAHASGSNGKASATDLVRERGSLLPLPPPWATNNMRGQLHAAIMSSSPRAAFAWRDAQQDS